MKSADEYIKIGIRESLRQEGKTYKEIETLAKEIYDILTQEV